MNKFENEIQNNGFIAYTNVGDSMMPLLRQNKDVIVVSKITKPLKKYDAVLFKRPNGAYVLHRIVKVCGNGKYKIAGDNRRFAETVPEEWIIGILTEVVKDGKRISTESDEYKRYVRKVPFHRFKLKVISLPHLVFGKIKRILSAG